MFLSPSIVTGVLTPYTDFALDSKETEQLTKIHQINKEYKNQANINFGKNSQSALHASTFFCITLISMKKYDEAKELITEISENLKTSNDIIFPVSANQLLKLIERIEPLDENNEKLKTLFALFNKRVSAEFKSRDRFKIKERIAQIEKKIKE